MDSSLKEFKKILKKNSLYVTKQRIALFTLLLNEQKPLSLQETAKLLDEKLDLVTVYRNVESLERINIIKKFYTGWNYRIELSEKFKAHHHHLSCSKCAKTIKIDLGIRIENSLKQIANNHNFRLTNHEVELYGFCQKCQSNSARI
ncbi:transcriptional repressor [Candidatus Saccharibacteria bacterium]|nr:transcriptional repressor [Candidatus Saccharibacteria bacterium]